MFVSWFIKFTPRGSLFFRSVSLRNRVGCHTATLRRALDGSLGSSPVPAAHRCYRWQSKHVLEDGMSGVWSATLPAVAAGVRQGWNGLMSHFKVVSHQRGTKMSHRSSKYLYSKWSIYINMGKNPILRYSPAREWFPQTHIRFLYHWPEDTQHKSSQFFKHIFEIIFTRRTRILRSASLDAAAAVKDEFFHSEQHSKGGTKQIWACAEGGTINSCSSCRQHSSWWHYGLDWKVEVVCLRWFASQSDQSRGLECGVEAKTTSVNSSHNSQWTLMLPPGRESSKWPMGLQRKSAVITKSAATVSSFLG